jgi:hypothetical protein
VVDDEAIRSGVLMFSSRPRGPRPSPLFRATRRGFGAEGAVVFASAWGY